MNDPKKNKELVEAFCTAAFIDHELREPDHYVRDDCIQRSPDAAQGRVRFTECFEKTFNACLASSIP
jgi:predicted SnoaL-like aldol condensation-catalyzing enzyme